MKNKTMPEPVSKTDELKARAPLGDALDTSITEIMRECATCGSKPTDFRRAAHPRHLVIEAMGRPWRHHVVCMICGHAVAAPTLAEALIAWKEGRRPECAYDLPQDCSDMPDEDPKPVNVPEGMLTKTNTKP